MSAPSAIALVRDNFQLRAELAENIRGVAAAATEENRQLTEAESAEIDKFTEQLSAADERIAGQIELQLRGQELAGGIESILGALVDRESGEVTDTRTLGEQFIDSDEFRSWAESGGTGNFRMGFDGVDLRALTTVGSGSDPLAGQSRVDRIGQDILNRRVFLQDMLPRVSVGTSSVEYVQDNSTHHYEAAEQTEGSSKQGRDATMSLVNEPVRTVAAYTELTRQVLEDFGQIPGYLDGMLRYGLKRRVDNQIINGNGTPPNLKGLGQRSNIATVAPASKEEAAVSVRKAITQGEINEAVYEIVVLNPADAEKFDLLNFSTAGLNAIADVTQAPPRTAWGLTRVVSNGVASGTALLIDPLTVTIFDRKQPQAYMTDSHDENFVKNILTLLLEARLGLGLFSAKGVCKVTFDYTT